MTPSDNDGPRHWYCRNCGKLIFRINGGRLSHAGDGDSLCDSIDPISHEDINAEIRCHYWPESS